MRRILAIDQASFGFGFAVLEGTEHLIDWGVKTVRTECEYRLKLQKLMIRYKPRILVLERELHSKRGHRARTMIETAVDLAASYTVATAKISREDLYKAFEVTNQEGLLGHIRAQFPQLTEVVNGKRRPSKPEDKRLAYIEAIGFGLTVLRRFEE